MAQQVDLYRLPMRGPGDISGLQRLLQDGAFAAHEIVAILGKTEGNGGVNDFTREYASASFCSLLAPALGCTPAEVEHRIALVMSGGTEGVLSPHASVFVRRSVQQAPAAGAPRMAIGVAHTRDFLPEELGRRAQIEETARAVRSAWRDAGIETAADVHFVQVKCPLLTAERVEQARQRGREPVTSESYASMAWSRGASALGVAVALGEVGPEVPDSAVLADWNLHSSVASTSAGIELAHNVVVVMGNSRAAAGELVIGHAVMRDAIDLAAVRSALASAGLREDGADAARIVNVFAKAEPSPDGAVRGFRHTMLDDTDISATRHARAAVGGLIAGVAGTGAIYVSGGAEHQGPAGGGPVAVVARARA
ncbi:ring-opening amidohydrolase [Ramlibacter sp.]|uniref:cyanuric acid amidohydrolase n=1 Tax=Ramlibacter sp. TaxID=1917967 RepID=UPI00261C427F|nr:ring-opening amidohydrolase [Ramlibacter sp.]MDB5958131.1 atzD [Ramlibacter sp.]